MATRKLSLILAGTDLPGVTEETITNAILASGFSFSEIVIPYMHSFQGRGPAYGKSIGIPVRVMGAPPCQPGPPRHRVLVAYGDRLVALWSGNERGTDNLIAHMVSVKKPIYIHPIALPSDSAPF